MREQYDLTAMQAEAARDAASYEARKQLGTQEDIARLVSQNRSKKRKAHDERQSPGTP